jgi:hypothetical protein
VGAATLVLDIDALVRAILPNPLGGASGVTGTPALDVLRAALAALRAPGLNEGIDRIAREQLGIPDGACATGLLGCASPDKWGE